MIPNVNSLYANTYTYTMHTVPPNSMHIKNRLTQMDWFFVEAVKVYLLDIFPNISNECASVQKDL